MSGIECARVYACVLAYMDNHENIMVCQDFHEWQCEFTGVSKSRLGGLRNKSAIKTAEKTALLI